jgi:bifunctional DNA-binding transcriptional regulator/antitoxin component of YhaV-PrlF toxin-antitoxin module
MELKNKNIRKLTRDSTNSFCITIPIEIVEKLKWKEHQKLLVNLSGKKVVIKDWKE